MTNTDLADDGGPSPESSVGRDTGGATDARTASSKSPVSGDSTTGQSRADGQQNSGSPSAVDAKRDERASIPSFPGRPGGAVRDDAAASGQASKGHVVASSTNSKESTDVLKGLLECVEQIVKELPRGTAAKWDGVQAQVAKARVAFDASCRSGASGHESRDRSTVGDVSASSKSTSTSSRDDADRTNASKSTGPSTGR